MDRFAQFAVAATNLALQDARVDNGWLATASVGDIIGTAVAGFSFAEEEHDTFRKKGAKHISPFLAHQKKFLSAQPAQILKPRSLQRTSKRNIDPRYEKNSIRMSHLISSGTHQQLTGWMRLPRKERIS